MTNVSRRQALITGAIAATAILSFPWKAESEPVGDLSAASARFGLDLLIELAKQHNTETNLAISPASLMAVFALADLGAVPELHAALEKIFHLGGATNFDRLRHALMPLISGQAASDSPVSGLDAVYVDKQVTLKSSALDAFKSLHARIESRRLADPDVPKEINALVNKATKGAIPSIIDAPLTGSGIVLVNALYFNDAWWNTFTKAAQDADFHLAGGGTRRVSMMHGISRHVLSAAQRGAFVAVRLPYDTDGYSLILVVNREKPARPADFVPVADWLSGMGLVDYYATVSLPRFSLKYGGDVLPALDALGLAPARSRPDALAGLSDAPLQIAAVPHKVAVKVDESGTTAAAATAVMAPTSAAPPPLNVPSLDLVVDKPFMFALHDENAGIILMTGYVGDPSDPT